MVGQSCQCPATGEFWTSKVQIRSRELDARGCATPRSRHPYSLPACMKPDSVITIHHPIPAFRKSICFDSGQSDDRSILDAWLLVFQRVIRTSGSDLGRISQSGRGGYASVSFLATLYPCTVDSRAPKPEIPSPSRQISLR